jgi:hypothetical protein
MEGATRNVGGRTSLPSEGPSLKWLRTTNAGAPLKVCSTPAHVRLRKRKTAYAGRRWTNLKGGNRGVPRCNWRFLGLWRLIDQENLRSYGTRGLAVC